MQLLPVTTGSLEGRVEESLLLDCAPLHVAPRDVAKESPGAPRAREQDVGQGATLPKHVGGHAATKGVPARGQAELGAKTAKGRPGRTLATQRGEKERVARGTTRAFVTTHLRVQSVDPAQETCGVGAAGARAHPPHDLAQARVLPRVEANGRSQAAS